jgi:hypothetical protein
MLDAGCWNVNASGIDLNADAQLCIKMAMRQASYNAHPKAKFCEPVIVANPLSAELSSQSGRKIRPLRKKNTYNFFKLINTFHIKKLSLKSYKRGRSF